jgi:putative flavoprotein involved in K+ transport
MRCQGSTAEGQTACQLDQRSGRTASAAGHRLFLLQRARNLPSMQLAGTPERATLDLNALSALGMRLVGRLAANRAGTALFSGSLPNVCALADLKLDRLLDTIDGWAARAGIDGDQPPQRFAPTAIPASTPLSVDLRASEIASIVWATGYRPELSWLHVPVLDRRGRIVHDGGVTAAPGLYLIGMPFLRAASPASSTAPPRTPPS